MIKEDLISLFIVNEIGLNHNKSLDHAKKLIFAAADAGMDAVKIKGAGFWPGAIPGDRLSLS
jgi:sialic acid synthase SpsE